MRHGIRAFIALALLGALLVTLLSERQKTADLSDELADMDHRTAAQVSTLNQQLHDAQAKAEALDLALSQAHDQLARSDDRHRSDEATATDAEAKLQTQRQQAAALADKLVDAERRAAVQVTDFEQRLETEQARAAGLDRELGEARRQLASTDDRQRSAEAAARDGEAASQAQRQQAAALADKLAETERRLRAEAKDLQERLESEHSRAASLELDLAEARLRLVQAPKGADDPSQGDGLSMKPGASSGPDRRLSANQTPSPVEPQLPAEQPAPGSVPTSELGPSAQPTVPPDGVRARIVLRYALGSDSAKARAQSAEVILLTQGMMIENHASPARGVSVSKVTFYYKEDQAVAKTISDVLARITGSDIVQKTPMSLRPLPRPGTIEVAISG